MESLPRIWTYKHLEEDEIRLIELQPAENISDAIKCRLFHARFKPGSFLSYRQEHPFEALSYVWGDPLGTMPISLESEHEFNQVFPVTKNLESALRHLRFGQLSRILWVDAICIDQSSLQERAGQVSQMRSIYKAALRVILWLGEENAASITVFNILRQQDRELRMRQLERAEQAHQHPQSESVLAIQRYQAKQNFRNGSQLDMATGYEKRTLQEIISHYPTEMWSFLRETFSQRPAWSRAWILQEIINAQDVIVLCGSQELPWKVLTEFLDACMYFSTDKERGKVDEQVIDAVNRAYYIHFYRECISLLSYRTQSIVHTWRAFSSWVSTDPRDRLFALLSLQVGKQDIRPDYTIRVRDLFCSVVRSEICATKNLDALCVGHPIDEYSSDDLSNSPGAPQPSQKSPDYALPSWVPDFGSSRLFANPHIYRYRRDRYEASGDTETPIKETSNPDQLFVKGIYMDQITTINPTRTRERRKFEDLQSLIRGVEAVQNFKQKLWASDGQTVSFAYQDRDPSTGFDGIGSWLIARPTTKFDQISQRDHTRGGESNVTSAYDISLGQDYPPRMVCLAGYVFCTTKKALKCMVPEYSRAGDILCVLYGSAVPHVLRPAGNCQASKCALYTLVGTAYVHDYMHGKALDEAREGFMKEEDFVLV